ncbi:unnamed protein product [Heterobilharzia americana]|nr:unnamed protein product [Heterobilharzia americana]
MTRSRRVDSRSVRGGQYQRRASDRQYYDSNRLSNPEVGLISSNCNHSTNMMGDIATSRLGSTMPISSTRNTRIRSYTEGLSAVDMSNNASRISTRFTDRRRTKSLVYRRRTCPSRRASVIARKRVRNSSISSIRRHSMKKRPTIQQRRRQVIPSQMGSSSQENCVSGSDEHKRTSYVANSFLDDSRQEVNIKTDNFVNKEIGNNSRNQSCSIVDSNKSVIKHPFLLLSSQCNQSLPNLESKSVPTMISSGKQTNVVYSQRVSWPTNSMNYLDSLSGTCSNITLKNNLITEENSVFTNNEACERIHKQHETDNNGGNVVDSFEGDQSQLTSSHNQFKDKLNEMNNGNILQQEEEGMHDGYPYFSSYSTVDEDSFS